jgi:chlorobactene glucosyltransferase
VLTPARNEEAQIGDCVRSLLAQDYPDYEVVVLDDHSTDRTREILDALKAADDRLRVLIGTELPPGWLGKHWACEQLAEAADGELLLFTDADTHHSPCSLYHGVAALEAERADFVTALPSQRTGSWAERLIVPVIPWSIFSFFPLALAHRLPWRMFSISIGQYMLFRRSAYAAIGGHSAVRDDAVDDIALGRRIKARGLRWRFADAGSDVSCRMYRNAQEVFEGFSKNLFAAFGYRLLPFVGVWAWLVIAFLLPVGVLLASVFRAPVTSIDVGVAWLGVTAGLILWGLCYLRFGLGPGGAILYPATVLLAAVIALWSVVLAFLGRATWKGRVLAHHPLRWL